MVSVPEVVKVGAGFLFVNTLTILADRYFSNRVAICVLVASSLVFLSFSKREIGEWIAWGQSHRTLAIGLSVLISSVIGLGIGLWLTKPKIQVAKTTEQPAVSSPDNKSRQDTAAAIYTVPTDERAGKAVVAALASL
jgi:ABC-type proline/glycine betaine transport system permease subunit